MAWSGIASLALCAVGWILSAEAFFRAYDQYRADAANWDAKYVPRPTAVTSAVTPATSPSITAYDPTIGPK